MSEKKYNHLDTEIPDDHEQQPNQEKNFKYSWENFPRPIRKRFIETYRRLKGYGLSKEQIFKELRIREQEISSINYIDARFGIPNKAFMCLKILDVIENLIHQENFQDKNLDHVARFIFDINYLKAVNDLSNHQIGDIFLQRIFETFKSGETTNWIKNTLNLDILLAAEGGDEITLLITDKKSLNRQEINPQTQKNENLLKIILKNYYKEIIEVPVDDLINFKDQQVLKKLPTNFSEKIKDFNFILSATVSGGYATLKDAWENLDSKEKEKSEEYLIDNLKLELLNLTDQQMLQNKKAFKEFLINHPDEQMRLLGELFRNDSGLAQENTNLKQQIADLKTILEKTGQKTENQPK